MCWNWNLMELLIFNFFFLEHVWPGPQMKTATSVFEIRWRWCTGLQLLLVWFSPLNLYLVHCMVSETWDFYHNLLF
jgi:hypothetical protein